MRRRRPAARIAAGGVGTALAALGLVAAAAQSAGATPSPTCTQSAATVTCTWSYMGTGQPWTVPAGVTSLQITADGASGGSFYQGASGGAGAEASGTVQVQPGTQLTIQVGGAGTSDGYGPFGGGGSGNGGASGGGSSSVIETSGPLVVAGGGGGAGQGTSNANGGTGGSAGSVGTNGGTDVGGDTGGGFGAAGTSSQGGTGGTFGVYNSGWTGSANVDGSPGGTGGQFTGGVGAGGPGGGGGGGGGGYYGGGGGGSGASGIQGSFVPYTAYAGGGGGGGGSSYLAQGGTIGLNASGVPQVVITYADSDLSLDQPSNISTDATGTNGAVVAYPVPLAHDPSDPTAPTAHCSPPSGSLFPVGTTQVTCGVSDGDDNPSVATVTFTVTVNPPDNDLSLDQPSNITTDATGSNGAVVTYQVPLAHDPDDSSAPTASCGPTPGEVFAIGTTQVTCSVSASDDINSPVSDQFTITVKGASAQLADLLQAVQGLGPGTSLPDKITLAQSELSASQVASTCSTLSAFNKEVQAQSGKSLTTATASKLVASTTQVQAVLGC